MSAVRSDRHALLQLTHRVFSEILPAMGYSLRPEQFRYALVVAEGIDAAPRNKRANTCMIEAPTGVGKALGYLVPCCLHAALTGERIGISTHTLALQDQLFGRKELYSGRQPVYRDGGRNSDLAVAIEATRRAIMEDTGQEKVITAAFRKGRSSYLDPDRALREIETLREYVGNDPENRVRLGHLEQWARRIVGLMEQVPVMDTDDATEGATRGEVPLPTDLVRELESDAYQGLITAYLEDHALPDGISVRDIGIIDGDGGNPWYRLHRGRIADADILVFSHAMRLLDIRSGSEQSILPPMQIMIHDECDTLGGVAEGWSHYRFRPVSLRNLLRDARLPVKDWLSKHKSASIVWKSLSDRLDAVIAALAAMHSQRKSGMAQMFLDDPSEEAASQVGEMFTEIFKWTQKLQKAVKEIGQRNNPSVRALCSGLADAAENLDHILQRVGKMSTEGDDPHDNYRVAAINWSPVIHLASIEIVDLYPGTVFALQWRLASAARLVVLTSATMRVPTTNRSDEWVFMRKMVGVRFGETGHVEQPDHFGDIGRIAMVLGAPKPFITHVVESDGEAEHVLTDSEEVEYDPVWLDMVQSALRLVADETAPGQCALVHAGSFRDVAEIRKMPTISGDGRFWLHDSQDLNKQAGVAALQNGAATVLVSPSFHAGVNLRAHDGSQLLSHIVTLRLPLQPQNAVMLAALTRLYRQRGYTNPEGHARRDTFSIQENAAIHRFTQQVGRGIRAPDDKIDLWILDPRFPVASEIRARIVLPPGTTSAHPRQERWLQALPERFQPLWHNAKVMRFICPDPGKGGWGIVSPLSVKMPKL